MQPNRYAKDKVCTCTHVTHACTFRIAATPVCVPHDVSETLFVWDGGSLPADLNDRTVTYTPDVANQRAVWTLRNHMMKH